MRRAAIMAAAALAGVGSVAAPALAAKHPRGPVPVAITASPGHLQDVQRALGASALRVVRRDGRDLQVVVAQSRVDALRALPGVAAAGVAPSSYADADPEDPGAAVPGAPKGAPVISEGVERVGADALMPLAANGTGVTIVILDLGFGGTHLPVAQAAGELPPAAQTETQSFDAAYGLTGRNAYGNLTNHGELVAQTVFDYAPKAHYIFVNYHTEQDFQAAVDWIIQRHPDVVVHSNSFLEGPFDGTGDAAQAVDRAAASGIAWVNSAGNYAEKHWQGPWVDANQDGVHDWPTDGWTFDMGANSPITFALSWNQDPGAEVTDLDLVLEHLDGSTWTEVASSRDDQVAGARSAERITNYLSPTGGTFRLRVVLAAGPPPGGDLTLFSREVTLDALGDPGPSSVPTPGDAEGSITVGAVDWRNDALKAYSSRGPTDDGRLKPDIVAPTGTRVLTATGPKSVGGTSNAAPNAGGALALLIGSQRAAGAPVDPASAKALLMGDALDLGDPGLDPQFGAGRLRVDVDPPAVTLDPATRAAMRTRFVALPLRVGATADDASRQLRWSVMVDGKVVTRRSGESSPSAVIGRSRLPDGPHVVQVDVTDWVGNVGSSRTTISVDSRTPRVSALRLAHPGAAATGADASAGVRATLDVRDYGLVRLDLTLARLNRRIDRRVTVAATGAVTIPVGPLPAGRYAATLTATDRAGNATTTRRILRITG
jgi:hypothetical protein